MQFYGGFWDIYSATWKKKTRTTQLSEHSFYHDTTFTEIKNEVGIIGGFVDVRVPYAVPLKYIICIYSPRLLS